MITEELLDRLVVATREAKETISEAHAARRDLRLACKEADERLGKIRKQVAEESGELIRQIVSLQMEKVVEEMEVARIGDRLRELLDDWMDLLKEATVVLGDMKKGTRVLR